MNGSRTSVLPLTWKHNPAGLGLLIATASLLAVGVIMVHSVFSSLAPPRGDLLDRPEIKHTLYAVAALAVLCVGWRLVDYRRLGGRWGLVALGLLLAAALALAAAVYVPGVGHGVGNPPRMRWIRIGSFQFQPSELVLLTMVTFLSAWLSREGTDLRLRKGAFWLALGVVGLCAGAVVKEDFGTAMLIGIAGVVTMFLAGATPLALLSFAVLAVVGFELFVSGDPRRVARLDAVSNPWDPNNPACYQVQQSLLAVMTGGWFGKGVGRGMLKRGFLPESSTDFVFSAFCEEWGLAGGLLLIAMLVAWMWLARRAAAGADRPFGRVLAAALGFTIALQAVLHLAVDLVAVPPKGVGMPFVSLGGTRLIVMAAAVAMIISVTAHKDPPEAEAAEPLRRSGAAPGT